MSQPKNINILLLGETGSGKSTFINSFANYMSYETYDEAAKSKTISLIGTTFTYTDKYFKSYSVKATVDSNESSGEDGESATQGCRTYTFSLGNGTLVRLMDTPGVGDTRGKEQDDENLDSILRLINCFTNLHAILVLMKANINRFTESFKYCFDKILSQLHQNVSKNIIFVFTHGRSVNYQPGNAINIVKKYLTEVKQTQPLVNIEYSQNIFYVFENDSFGHLIARMQNSIYETDEEDLRKTWTKSSQECRRLFEHVTQLTPHNIIDTISINKLRHVLVDLLDPLANIFEVIDNNLTLWEEQKQKIERAKGDLKSIRELMITKCLDVEIKKLIKPKLVCKTNQCREKYVVGGFTKYHYSQTCCHECGRWNHFFGHGDNIKFESRAFLGPKYCSKCNCSQQEHKILYYDTIIVYKDVAPFVKNIKSFEGTLTEAQETVKVFEELVKTYENEKKAIIKSAAIFSIFLQKNAIVPLKDHFKEKLSQHINNALLQRESEKRISHLNKTLEEYEEEVNKNILFDISTKDIMQLKEELCSLKLYGKKIKEVYLINEQAFESEKLKEQSAIRIKILKFNRYIEGLNS